jgi:hypothetical protein
MEVTYKKSGHRIITSVNTPLYQQVEWPPLLILLFNVSPNAPAASLQPTYK